MASVASVLVTTPVMLRSQRTTRRACRLVLLCAMILFFCLFLRLTYTLYDQFAYMTFDLGIFDQAVWLISQGKTPFVTARGTHILGDHFSVILYLLAPFYAVAPTPKTLLFLQTLAVTLGAIPTYALARKRLQSEPKGLLFGILYLLYPAHQWGITYEFHPDMFATPLLFTALYALEARRFRLYAVALIATALIKESAGLTIACIGVWAWFPNRKVGAVTIAFGGAMLVVAMLTVRHFNDGQPSPYFEIFRHFGSSPGALVGNFIRRPLPFLAEVFQLGNLYYLGLMLISLCFLPLFAPEVLLLALPMLVLNFMSGRPGMHTFEEYYNAFLTPLLFLAAIVGFQRLEKWGWFTRWLIRLNLPLWALTGISMSPYARPIAELYSTRPPDEAVAECRSAVAQIPQSASVSAQMAFGAHLAHRIHLYTFPNPFVRAAYGGTSQALFEIDSVTSAAIPADLEHALAENSGKADYLVLCPKSNPFPLSDNNFTRVVVALLQSRTYETESLGVYVMVLKRVTPGSARLEQLAARTRMPVRSAKQVENAYWHWLALQYPPPKRSRP